MKLGLGFAFLLAAGGAAVSALWRDVSETAGDLRRELQTAQRELDFVRVLRNVPAVAKLGHLDLAGKEQLRVSRLDLDVDGSGEDLSRTPAFVTARTGKTYWSPVYLKNEAEPYVTLAVPVGKYAVEVTTAEVSLAPVLKIVTQIEVGPGGYAYVVDPKNHLVAHPDGRLLRMQRDLSDLAQIKAARAALAAPSPDTSSTLVALRSNPFVSVSMTC